MANPWDEAPVVTAAPPTAAPAANPWDSAPHAPATPAAPYGPDSGYDPNAARNGPIKFPGGGGQMPDGSVTRSAAEFDQWQRPHLDNAPTKAAPAAPVSLGKGINQAGRSFAQMASMGFGDEFAAGMDAATYGMLGRGAAGQTFNDRYQQNLGAERKADAEIPASISIPAGLAGGVVSMMAGAPLIGGALKVAGAGTRLVPGMNTLMDIAGGGADLAARGIQAIPGGSTALKLGGVVGENAALGGVQGYGESEGGVDQRLAGATRGAEVGAVLGPVAQGVAKMAVAPFKVMRNYIAPFVGGERPLTGANGEQILDAAGKPVGTLAGGPLEFTAGQKRLAGEALDKVTTGTSADARAKIDNFKPPIPGDIPTTAQLLEDQRMLEAERSAMATTPGAPAAFRTAADQRNDARVGELRTIAPGGQPGNLSDKIARDAATQDAGLQGNIDAARTKADQRVGSIGGDHGPAGHFTAGTELAKPVLTAMEAERKRLGAVYDAVDPGNKLVMDVRPIREQAEAQLAELGPLGGKLNGGEGAEAGIFGDAKNMNDAHLFKDVRKFRGRITDRLRKITTEPGNALEKGRLDQLLKTVDSTLDGATIKAPEAGPPVASGAAVESGSPALIPNELYRPGGERVPIKYKLVEARDLVTSHLDNGTSLKENPAYPQDKQPRDRNSVISLDQINEIHKNNQPHMLGASTALNEGAPVANTSREVISGNARVLGVRRLYAEGGPKAQEFRDSLAGHGDVSKMDEPILIRELPHDMDTATQVKIADEATRTTGLGLAPRELAKMDAKGLSDDVLAHLQPGSKLDSEANAKFVQAFARDAVDPTQRGTFGDKGAMLSKDGAQRIRNALVHKAYGDAGLTASLSESGDPAAKVMMGALEDGAGPMARLRSGIDGGRVPKDMDIAPALVEATRIVQTARSKGFTIGDVLAQQDMTAPPVSPMAEQLLKAAYGEKLSGRMSGDDMGKLISEYAKRAENQPMTPGMFGDKVTASEIVSDLSSKFGKDAKTGQAPPAAPVSATSTQTAIPPPKLEPNLDPDAVQRLREANAQYSAYNDKFKTAQGVSDITAPGPKTGQFETPRQSLPDVIVATGPNGSVIAKNYLAAGGTKEELADKAALSLKDYVRGKEDNPAPYAAWLKSKASFLAEIPEAAQKFRNIKDAKQAIIAAEERMSDAIKARQSSAVGRFLPGAAGERNPVAEVGKIINDDSLGLSKAKSLAAAAKGDPDAEAGLQNAVVSHVLSKLKGNAEGAASEESYLKGDKFLTFINDHEATIRTMVTPKQWDSFVKVGKSLKNSNLSLAGSAVGAGSDTTQKAVPFWQRMTQQYLSPTVGTSAGAGVGFAFFGPTGAMVGAGLGNAGGKALQDMRAAGVKKVDDLFALGLKHPEIFSVLTAKVTPKNEQSLISALGTAVRRAGVAESSGSLGAVGRPGQPAAPLNTLLH